MSSKGEIALEWGVLLEAIADRLDTGLALKKDARALRRIARQAKGADPKWSLKAHRAPYRPAKGSEGVMLQYRMAAAVRDYMDKHACGSGAAIRSLVGQFGHNPSSERTIMNAWQRMRHVLELPPSARQSTLEQMCFEAENIPIIVKGALTNK